MKLHKNETPKLKLPKFKCDSKLSPQLDANPLLRGMNRHFATAVLGKAGSGKTSLVTGLLNTSGYLKKVFDTILVFVPPNSRASMGDDCIWNKLPKDQVYDELNIENLRHAFGRAEKNAETEKQTLIVFDDVQRYFKQRDVEPMLLHMCNNRRHNRLSLFFIAQSYQKISRQLRLAMTDLFCFKLSKSNMDDIFKEMVECTEDQWNQINAVYKKRAKDTDGHHFLYLDANHQRFFIDWDEVVIEEDSDGEVEMEEDDESHEVKRRRVT